MYLTMKKFILLFISTFLVLTSSFAQNFGWVDYRSKIPKFPYDTVYYGETPVVAMFSDVFFTDDDEGWITVRNGGNNTPDSAVILHTIDGGENWELQPVPSICNTIWMLNKNEGYAGSQDGRIYKTTDGGENWLFHSIPAGPIVDIAFPPDSEIGYAVVDQSAYLFRIKPDTLERIDLNSNNFWTSVTCPTVDDVWFVGGLTILYYNGDSLEYSGGAPYGYFSCICFANPTLGWASNDGIVQGYYEPKDSWVEIEQTMRHSTDMSTLGEDHLWVVGYNGLLMNTHNAKDFKRLNNGHAEVNVVWETPTHPLEDAAFLSIHASSVNSVFVVGQEKIILKYTEVSGIEDEVEPLKFKIFPNPAVGELQVSSYGFRVSGATVEIYDLNGKKLIEKHIPQGNESFELNVSGLKSGVYFCRISTKEYSVTKKLIIQK
jgi:hypothetical protein